MSRTRLDLTPYMQDIVSSSLYTTMNAVQNAWGNEAKSRLHTTANDYIKGIRSKFRNSGSGYEAEIWLEGKWANKLEQGFPSYDMKPILAGSSKKKISEESGQWYIHVPFKYSTPSATGRTAPKMPNSVYRAARALPQWGKLSSGQGTLGKYEGLTKVPESPTSKRSSYMSFRTVSENSSPSAFIHPGFAGVHIAEDLVPQIADTFMAVFNSGSS